jgi:hypothetical protein
MGASLTPEMYPEPIWLDRKSNGEPTRHTDVQASNLFGSDMDDYRDLVIAGLFLACTGAALVAGLLYIEYGAQPDGLPVQHAPASSSLPVVSKGQEGGKGHGPG